MPVDLDELTKLDEAVRVADALGADASDIRQRHSALVHQRDLEQRQAQMDYSRAAGRQLYKGGQQSGGRDFQTALAQQAALSPDFTAGSDMQAEAQQTGRQRGVVGGIGASFVDPGLQMLAATGDTDAQRELVRSQMEASAEGGGALAGRGIGMVAQAVPMLMSGLGPAGAVSGAVKGLAQVPFAMPIAAGSAEEVAQAHPVYDSAAELAGRTAQAASLGISRQGAMMAAPLAAAPLTGPLMKAIAPAGAGVARTLAARALNVPIQTAAMTAAQTPGEALLNPNPDAAAQAWEPDNLLRNMVMIGAGEAAGAVGDVRANAKFRQAQETQALVDKFQMPASVAHFQNVLDEGRPGYEASLRQQNEDQGLQALARDDRVAQARKAAEIRQMAAQSDDAVQQMGRETVERMNAADWQRRQEQQAQADAAEQARQAEQAQAEAAQGQPSPDQIERVRQQQAQAAEQRRAQLVREAEMEAEQRRVQEGQDAAEPKVRQAGADDLGERLAIVEESKTALEQQLEDNADLIQKTLEEKTSKAEHLARVEQQAHVELQGGSHLDQDGMLVDASGAARPLDRSIMRTTDYKREFAARRKAAADAFDARESDRKTTLKRLKSQRDWLRPQLAEISQSHRDLSVLEKRASAMAEAKAAARTRDYAREQHARNAQAQAEADAADLASKSPQEPANAAGVTDALPTPKTRTPKGRTPKGRIPAAAPRAPGDATSGGESRAGSPGSAGLPELRASGDGAGLPTARGAAAPERPGTRSGAEVEPASAGSAAELPADRVLAEEDPLERRIREARVREEQAKLEAEQARGEGRRSDAEKKRAEVETEGLKAQTAEAIKAHAANVADQAVAENARNLVQKLIGAQEERVKVAEARLAKLTDEKAPVKEAQADLAEAKADLAEANRDQDRLRSTAKDAKADVAKGKQRAYMDRKIDNAERLRPAIEEGVRRTIAPDATVTVDRDTGLLNVNDKDGKRLFTIDPSVEKREMTAEDAPSWWSSMGERDGVLRWLSGAVRGYESQGKRALRLLEGRRPASLEDLVKTTPPKKLVELMKLAPPGGGYDPATRSVKFYDAENIVAANVGSVNAVQLGQHEANHWIVHGLIGAAMRSPEMAGHLETLIKAVKIDPRGDPSKLVPFLEAVYRKYAAWRPGYNAEREATLKPALEAAKSSLRANSPIYRAFDDLRQFLATIGRSLRLVGDSKAGVALNDVFKSIADGSLLSEAEGPTPGLGKSEAMATVDSAANPRREATDEDKNLSMGSIRPEHRSIADQIRSEFEAVKPGREATFKKLDASADQAIAEKGIKAATREAIDDAKRLQGKEDVPDAALKAEILNRNVNRILDNYANSGRLEGKELHETISALMATKGDVGAALASFRDRWATPDERAQSIRTNFWKPSSQQALWFKRVGTGIAKAQSRGDTASAAKAQKLYNDAMDRFVAGKETSLAKMRKWGVDFNDHASLTKLLDGEAWMTSRSDLEDLQLQADSTATAYDWIIANYRANLLGDLSKTPPMIAATNAMAALSRTAYLGVRNPGALWAALRGGAITAAIKNGIASYGEGKNVWSHEVQGQALGSMGSEGYSPNDAFSKANRLFSINFVSMLDGAFQRYNAQLEAASMVYQHERAGGASMIDASRSAYEQTHSNMANEVAIEALFRSLPGTYQELALRKPGVDDPLEKVASWLSKGGGNLDRALGNALPLLKDKVTGEAVPIPVSKLLIPFTRTALSVLRAGVQNSVLGTPGIYLAARKYSKVKNDAGATDTEKRWAKEQIVRRGFESMVIGAVGMHMLAAWLDATGTDEDDKGGRTGTARGEKTVMLGGRQYSYARLEPYSTTLAMAANGLKALREGKGWTGAAGAEMEALMKIGSDLPWMRLTTNIAKFADDHKRGRAVVGMEEGVATTLVNMTPVAGQAGLRNMFKPGDEYTKAKEHGFVPQIQREFGGNTVPMLDKWGRQVQRGPFETTDDTAGKAGERVLAGAIGRAPLYRPTDVDSWVKNRGAHIPEWDPKEMDGKTKMPPERADEFIAKAGPKLLDSLRQYKEAYPEATPKQIDSFLSRTRPRIAKVTRREMTLDLPEPDETPP